MADQTSEHAVNPRSGMTHGDMKLFIRRHFDDFVNKQRLDVADVNFAAGFVDHGDDVPPGLPAGPAGAKRYLESAFKRFPDIHVVIEDMIAEDDKVVVRNRWTGTEAASGERLTFCGIVIWRIAGGKIQERWAYLQKPHSSAV